MKTWDEMGGAAFPVDTHDETPLDAETGMSLRDWFAGQALAGMNVHDDRGIMARKTIK